MTVSKKVQFFSLNVITEVNGTNVRNDNLVNIFNDINSAPTQNCKLDEDTEHYSIIDVNSTNISDINGIMTKVRKIYLAKIIKSDEKSPRRQLQLNNNEFLGDLTYFHIFDLGTDRSGIRRYLLAILRDSYGPWYRYLEYFLLKLPFLTTYNIKEVHILPLVRKDIAGALDGRRRPYALYIDIPILAPVSKYLKDLDENIFAASKAFKKLGGEDLSVKIQIQSRKSLRSKGVDPLKLTVGKVVKFFKKVNSEGQTDLLNKLNIKLRDEITEKITTMDLLEEFVMYDVEFDTGQDLLNADMVHRKIKEKFTKNRREINKYFSVVENDEQST